MTIFSLERYYEINSFNFEGSHYGYVDILLFRVCGGINVEENDRRGGVRSIGVGGGTFFSRERGGFFWVDFH